MASENGNENNPPVRKKSEKETKEYLLLNYPQDIRKNLKDVQLPEDLEKQRSKEDNFV